MRDPHEHPVKYLMQYASEYIARTSNGQSLITITSALPSVDGKYVTFGVSVLPEHKEPAVIDFLTRSKDDVRAYIKKHMKLRRLPYIQFMIDVGEKNRQTIDTLLHEDENSVG